MKNTFYFTSKTFFVLNVFKFLSWLFGHAAKRLGKKNKVHFKPYDGRLSLVNKPFLRHISPNISRIKGNKTTTFCQLIECDMSSIFLEKSYTKSGGEFSARPFSEKLKLSISLDQYPKVLHSLFLLYAKLRAIEIYWN